jgi:hypothetical protein
MIKFYTNKELSQAFQINLAKWKRWSREFLPPDPLGGLQSGFARQYNLDEAFSVFLGGHLVGDLKFTIPESRQILNDLRQWLVDHNFYFNFSGGAHTLVTSAHPVQNYQIAIINRRISSGLPSDFSYWVKAVLAVESVDFGADQVYQERYQHSSIGPPADISALPNAESYCILNINALRRKFLSCLQEIA